MNVLFLAIFLLSVAFAWLCARAASRRAAFAWGAAALLVLALPAALRYGVGCDYGWIYMQGFNDLVEIGRLRALKWEGGYTAFAKAVLDVTESPQWVFALSAALTYLFFLLSVPRRSLPIAVFGYVCVAYFVSWNWIRQELAVSMVLFAASIFAGGKGTGRRVAAVALGAAALSVHKSVAVAVPLFALAWMLGKANRLKTELGVLAVGVFCIFFNPCECLFKILLSIPATAQYARYLNMPEFVVTGASKQSSGLGALFRFALFFSLFVFIRDRAANRRDVLLSFWCAFAFVMKAFELHAVIFDRISCMMDLCIPFALSAVYRLEKSRYKPLFLAMAAGLAAIFLKDYVLTAPPGPHGVLPYRLVPM